MTVPGGFPAFPIRLEEEWMHDEAALSAAGGREASVHPGEGGQSRLRYRVRREEVS